MSSPDDESNIQGKIQHDSNNDPSSSSMSGYDLKGMLSKHQQQLQQIQFPEGPI